ncbi:MAG TPA: protein kinase [Polyangia bacterium]|nr:protein kinase [Polyangia bacterium]
MTSGRVAVARVGELVGAKYRIVRLLAEGGMGVVYEAQHTVVRRRFAVKFMRRDLAERRDILTRFQREAEAAGALESEHVAAAVDFGIAEDGAPYIVMEYLVGESLTALLGREGPLPVARAADLVSQAGRGMEVAHAAGIIHRDLKPQNLFVCRRQDGTDLLKVLDFGVAKLQTIDEMNAATRTGAVVGTVAYMSPEQARGDKVVDQRSDVYALGAILYELCSGRKPHPGESHNAILHHIATQAAVPLASIAPDLPVGFLEIVAGALAADPAARPPSAGALVEALAPFAKREVWPAPKLDDSGAARVSLTPSSPVAEARGISGSVEAGSRARRRWRPSRVGSIVGASAVGLVGVLVVLGAVRQKQIAASRAVDAPAAKPSLASSERPPVPARPAFISNVASSPTAAPPAVPLTGTGGAAVAHPARRHAARPAPVSTVSSTPPAAPTTKPPVAPVTFDRQNPYE